MSSLAKTFIGSIHPAFIADNIYKLHTLLWHPVTFVPLTVQVIPRLCFKRFKDYWSQAFTRGTTGVKTAILVFSPHFPLYLLKAVRCKISDKVYFLLLSAGYWIKRLWLCDFCLVTEEPFSLLILDLRRQWRGSDQTG